MFFVSYAGAKIGKFEEKSLAKVDKHSTAPQVSTRRVDCECKLALFGASECKIVEFMIAKQSGGLSNCWDSYQYEVTLGG